MLKEIELELLKDLQKENGVTVLLKGYNTIITDGDKVFVNPTGNSAMASGEWEIH